MGFQTELEKPFGKFCADIWIPEINWVVEIDGPTHWLAKDKKRDDYLNENHGITAIVHVGCDITKEQFEEVFSNCLEREFGEDKIGSVIEKRS